MSALLGVVPGVVVGTDFRIVRPLSEGGMGAVYVAEQLSTGKQRALKVMQPSLVSDQRLRERFVQEARIGARIESEHIVEVVGAGVDAALGMPWIAMELLKGETLAGRVHSAPLSPADAREVFDQLSHALSAAHDAGVVHRDLKPENIFLATSRRRGSPFTVKVLDFGIAKIVAEAKTRSTAPMGTALWMAPEQTDAGRGVDPATDVWALGLIAFHVLTGHFYWRSPYQENPSPMTMVRELVVDALPPLRARARELGVERCLPDGFCEWFGRCVDRAVDRRFRDAREALTALDAVLAGVDATRSSADVAARPPSGGTVPMRPEPLHEALYDVAADTGQDEIVGVQERPRTTTGAAVGIRTASGHPPTSRTRTIAVASGVALALVGSVAVIGSTWTTSPTVQSPTLPSAQVQKDEGTKHPVTPTAEQAPTTDPTSTDPTPSASTAPSIPPKSFGEVKKPVKQPAAMPSAPVASAPEAIPAAASEGSAPSAAPGDCSAFKGDYVAAMREKEYACVRRFLLPRLNAGQISTGEARYLKAACGALGDSVCEKRAAEKL